MSIIVMQIFVPSKPYLQEQFFRKGLSLSIKKPLTDSNYMLPLLLLVQCPHYVCVRMSKAAVGSTAKGRVRSQHQSGSRSDVLVY